MPVTNQSVKRIPISEFREFCLAKNKEKENSEASPEKPPQQHFLSSSPGTRLEQLSRGGGKSGAKPVKEGTHKLPEFRLGTKLAKLESKEADLKQKLDDGKISRRRYERGMERLEAKKQKAQKAMGIIFQKASNIAEEATKKAFDRAGL